VRLYGLFVLLFLPQMGLLLQLQGLERQLRGLVLQLQGLGYLQQTGLLGLHLQQLRGLVLVLVLGLVLGYLRSQNLQQTGL
jgi:hypothetical protein